MQCDNESNSKQILIKGIKQINELFDFMCVGFIE